MRRIFRVVPLLLNFISRKKRENESHRWLKGETEHDGLLLKGTLTSQSEEEP